MFKALKITSYVLVIIGALNWGFVGWLNFNLVEALLGSFPLIVRVVYALVGVAALVSIFTVVRKSY